MAIWTYVRCFRYQEQDYEVRFAYSLRACTSQLFCDGGLIDEQSFTTDQGMKVIEHKPSVDNGSDEVTVSVGYYSWWNIGIEVKAGDDLIHASHPGKDLYFAVKKLAKLEKLGESNNSVSAELKREEQARKWQSNKYSIFADIGLGIAFYIVAKATGDLTLAALVGVALGLGLVVVQRFVKIDLLGGFAVFGTLMLMISGMLSLMFQSDYFVQLKGTIMGLLGAAIFLSDGLFRKGHYFGTRFERYFSSAIDQQFFVVGLGLIGLVMASANYLVATYLSEDTWLTYKTFIDDPVNFILFFILLWHAGRRASKSIRIDHS